jgi:hypothetical protein
MEEYQNPPERWSVVLASMLFILFLSGALYLFVNDSLLAAIILLVFGPLIFFAAVRRPLLLRPKSISFSEEGITLFLPRNKQRIVKWGRLVGIHVIEGNPKTFLGRLERGSVIREKGSRVPIDLSFELGILVKNEYWKRFGDRVYQLWTYQTRRNLK